MPTKLFQSALFSCLPKVDQVINVQKAYREMTPKRNVIRVEILTSRPCLLRELEPDNPNSYSKPRGGHSHTLPIQVCAAQRGRDFEAPDLERGIHFRGVF